MSAAVATFPTCGSAVETVQLTIQSGILVARIELLDAVQMRACIAHSKLAGLEPAPTLFFEFHGSAAGVAEQAAAVEAIAGDFGGTGFAAGQHRGAQPALRARHDAYYGPGAPLPLLRLGHRCLRRSRSSPPASPRLRPTRCAALAPLVGHVGDGNFHLLFLLDPDDLDEQARAKAVNAWIDRALALGGTRTASTASASQDRQPRARAC
ncbi:MAG: FAD-linked oxidase C-terminal domain-containing protein [Geminicoccaceae bacterium]